MGNFGQEKGNKPGPDRATTRMTIGENVVLKLSVGNKSSDPDATPKQRVKTRLATAGAGKVVCRLCKGNHSTPKCPYKESLAGLESTGTCKYGCRRRHPASTSLNPVLATTASSTGSGGKYVPSSTHSSSTRTGESMSRLLGSSPGGSRDNLPTLRATNISEETLGSDMRELFAVFGRVVRVYVGRDREAGAEKGFVFVSFEKRTMAKKAIERDNGMGHDNLIVWWSQSAQR